MPSLLNAASAVATAWSIEIGHRGHDITALHPVGAQPMADGVHPVEIAVRGAVHRRGIGCPLSLRADACGDA